MFENTQKNSGSQNVFDAIASAEGLSYNNQWIKPGVYPLLYVDVLKLITTRQGDTMFIAEFDVLVSDSEAFPKGTRMCWSANFRHEPSPKNVKIFLATLMNKKPEEVTAEGAKFAVSEKNPCHGRLIRAEAYNNDKDFTLVNWRPIPDNIQARADDLRQETGFTPI